VRPTGEVEAVKQPTYSLILEGGTLAGMTFTIGDWSFPDEPPGIVWLAEVAGADGTTTLVGHGPDKAVLNAVAAQEKRGLPGWTPYERAVDPRDETKPAQPQGGVYRYTWARRMDPAAQEPRHLQAVS